MERIKQALIYGLVHFAAWVIAEFGIILAFQHSDARMAYALLTAWWSALYFGYVLRVRLAAIGPLSIYYLTLFSLDNWYGWEVIYHDSSPISSVDFWVAYIFSFMVFSSPIVINAAVRKLQEAIVVRMQ